MADSNRLTKYLAVALAVGVAFIAVFVLVVGGGVLFSEGQSDSITIGVGGIDGERYSVGDELDVLVRIQGVTFDCAAPRAAIVNTDTSKTLWDSGISLVLCDPALDSEGYPTDIVWQLGQYYTENGMNHTSQNPTKIVPTEAGEYALVISFGGHESTVPFTVHPRPESLPPPSPPIMEYPLLENITSFISTPFTIGQNQNLPVEFKVRNENDFTLYDVQIYDFSTASIPLVLTDLDDIDKLAPNETQTISAMVTTNPKFNETGTSSLFWTVLAKDEAGKLMQSTMFQRDITVTGNRAEGQDKITVQVNVGGEPQQSEVQSGMGGSLATKYLPVNITQTINLAAPTKSIVVYPVFADWDGIVRGGLGSSMVDENNNPVAYDGFGTLSLHGVRATCTEPYPIQLTTDILADDGIRYVNTTEPVSSSIPWGDTVNITFNGTQSGTIHYTVGYGIVPADYNDNNGSTYRNNGAGNQDISGEYHLSFTSFYSATVNLPEQVDMASFLEARCTINEDSVHIEKSEMPYIYVYDVWFSFDDGDSNGST